MKRSVVGILLFFVVTVSSLWAQSVGEIEIIFDASRSMNKAMGSSTRLAEAKTALTRLADQINPEARVGLRIFGSTPVYGNIQQACLDSKLVLPIQPYNKQQMLDEVAQLQAYGQTPIGHSLFQAVQDFTGGADVPKTIILISDGEESCGQDPLAVVQDLKAKGVNVIVHTIGFDVDAAARAQLERIAQLTGGVYADARNATELEQRLAEAGEKAKLLVPQKSYGANILSPSLGTTIVSSSTPLFAQLIDGKEENVGAFYAGQEVVFAFPDAKPYLVKSFSLPIFEENGINVARLQLFGSLEGPDREFFPIGKVEVQNKVFFDNVYQEFAFDPPMPARFLKVVVGPAHDGSSRNYQAEWKVKGQPLSEEELANLLAERGKPRMDLMEPGNGGELVASENPGFAVAFDGAYDGLGNYESFRFPTEGIVGFGGRTAVIEKVAFAISEKADTNIKTIEFFVSKNAPTGPYEPAGTFQTMNMAFAGSPFQEFQFDPPPLRAKFLKIRLVDAFNESYGFLYEIKLIGYLED